MVLIPTAPRLGDMPTGSPLPEATYHIRVDAATYKTSREKGTPMCEVQFTVFGPEDAEEFHGRKVFDNLMLDGEGMFRTRLLLEAAGMDEDFVLEDTDQLIGLEVAAALLVEKERTGEDGKTYPARSRIGRYLSIE